MGIKKIYTCWGRTRNHEELARFESFVFFFFRKGVVEYSKEKIKIENGELSTWDECT